MEGLSIFFCKLKFLECLKVKPDPVFVFVFDPVFVLEC